MATTEQVIAAHLRYSAVAEPLRTRAHAQILAKVLYLGGERSYLTMSKMRDGIAELTGGARPSRADTQAALKYAISVLGLDFPPEHRYPPPSVLDIAAGEPIGAHHARPSGGYEDDVL